MRNLTELGKNEGGSHRLCSKGPLSIETWQMTSMKVFSVPFEVRRAHDSIMPDGLTAAFVTCYSTGVDYRNAIENCIAALTTDGLQVAQILEPIHSLDASDWTTHKTQQWPDHVSYLASQDEFEAAMAQGRVMYGPFAAYQ